MSASAITEALDRVFRSRLSSIVGSTTRRWGAVDPTRVEDAVHDVAAHVLSHPAYWQRVLDDTGRGGFERVFRRAVHRRLCRTTARDGASSPDPLDVLPSTSPSACRVVEARQELQRLDDLVDDAARRFGGTAPQRLRGALVAKLVTGVDNSEAARLHDTRREYVSRAMSWLLAQAA